VSPVSSETEIFNLLYRYAELIDSGRFDEIASELFAHARLIVGPEGTPTFDARQMLDTFTATTIRYADGTPRTKHVITNPILEVDEDAGTATCRSYYTVFQQTGSLPLQPVVSGRYHDRFERVAGKWRFVERDYTKVDLVGDVSQHLTFPLRPPSA
jgi:3-phenylpropionate/cinnamic acid dioxygenase small subunit